MGFGAGDYELYMYIIIPFAAGIVGWATNVLALKMTFYPTEYLGIDLYRIKNQPWGFFGIQGIIPSKAGKIASTTIDVVTTKLINLKEVFDKLDPIEFSNSLEDASMLMLDNIIKEIAMEYIPETWNSISEETKNEVVLLAHQECPDFLSKLMKDVQENIYDVLDLKDMSVNACVENKAVLNKIFKETGDKEFQFIERSGFYFGFLFGILQSIGVIFYPDLWVLPIYGFLVGWCTNYLALWFIFSPLEPKRFCGITFHGLFLRRQKEVSATFSRIICVDIVHVKAVWDAILNGPKKRNFDNILRAHTILFTEKLLNAIKAFVVIALGSTKYAQLKENLAMKVIEKLPTIIDHSYLYMTKAMNLEETMRERMEALPYSEFEVLLHTAFQEDEILLIIVGGILGMITGIIQLYAFRK